VEHHLALAVEEICPVSQVENNQSVSLERAAYGALSRPRHETEGLETLEM
jgi:hypothetical protein